MIILTHCRALQVSFYVLMYHINVHVYKSCKNIATINLLIQLT